MKERIIVVPGSLDLARTLAYHGKALFNVRIFTPVELAEEALMRSGNLSKREFVSRKEELTYYPKIVDSVPYFKTKKLSDLKKTNSTVNTIRELIADDEFVQFREKLSRGQFKEKNDALIDVYEKYAGRLEEENKVDTIGLIREAIGSGYVFDGEMSCIREYPLQPLDTELIRALSDGKCREISLFDLFDVKDNGIHVDSYKNCYGSSNEVGVIIDDIYKNKKADQCIVACADYDTYSQIFYDHAVRYDIPVCFGGGLSIVNSYPGKLLQMYHLWMSPGNFGWEPFFRLIYSPYFDFGLLSSQIKVEDEKEFDVREFWNRVSRLRLTNDKKRNDETIRNFRRSISRKDLNDNNKLEKYVRGMEIVAEELALSVEDFLMKYCVVRKDDEFSLRFDEAAKNAIHNEITLIRRTGLEITDDVIETILRKMVFRQSCEPGHLYVCEIGKAASVLRKDLYVCGLSAAAYPGTPKENPLLLDCDLEDLGNESLTSRGKIGQKREDLFSLVRLASALGNGIAVSYPGQNVSELKHNNGSSLIFELFREENGTDKQLKDLEEATVRTGYFDPELSISRKIGKAYNESDDILYRPASSGNEVRSSFGLYKYSPSQLNTFFNCKKQYLFQNLLKIPVPDDYDPYEVIPVTEQGTLAHSLMEYLSEHPMGREEFSKFAETAFDEYMNITVPLIRDKIPEVKGEFVEMLENGWDMDDKFKRKVAFKEEDKAALHEESGVVIHGYPDRVEFTEDGKAVIIDFKTERDLNAHATDDIDSCLQVVMYAYIVEKALGYKVDHCEYRMLRYGADEGIITCKYDDEIREGLTEKLLEFRRCMEEGDFDIGPMSADEERERCKYCKYGAICGKIVTEDEEE